MQIGGLVQRKVGLCYLRRQLGDAIGGRRRMADLAALFSRCRLATRHVLTGGAPHAERSMALAFLGCFTLALLLPLLQTLYPIFGTLATPLEERRGRRPLSFRVVPLVMTGEIA